MPSADVLRALAHGLIDAAAISAVLALVAALVARLPGIDAATRSRCWSAVAIVPLLAFAAALCQPLVAPQRDGTSHDAGTVTSVLLVDPLDALQRGAVPAAARASGAAATHAGAAGERPAPIPWIPFAVALWITIAAFRLAGVGLSLARAHRLARAAHDAEFAPVARDAAAARVALRVRDDIDMPVAIGVTQRTVILPAKIAALLPASELRAVVLHEIAHLRRRDDWVYLLERLAAAVLWFDPIVFVAIRASASSREIACDASAAREAGGRICASALWRSAGAISAAGARRSALALHSGGPLVERVEALLRPAATSPRRALAATLALALCASAASVVAVVRAPAYGSPGTQGLTPTGSMHTRRASFAFVKLRDGRVLVAGGMIANQNFTSAAEVYDPARGVFEPTGSMADGRVGLTGTLLGDGRVLVAGGWTSHGVTAATELYDPATGRFTAGAPMHSPRAGHTATTLRDGRVLIAGGAVANNVSGATAELYDPRSGAFSEVAPMHEPRASHTATLLADGRVLVAGGGDGPGSLSSTELFDPIARRFVAGPAMHEPRSKQGAQLLADGSVLIVGGGADGSWASRLDTTERYEPAANRFVPAATMHARRFKLIQSTTRLPNGDVLVAGGNERVELYETARDRFRLIDGTMENARNLGGAVLLDDGSVLIAGGYANVNPLPTTDTALRYR
jgi:beta-lactamase regulating signal transducer with metallopeptidase domain